MKHLAPAHQPEYWRMNDIAAACAKKWRSGLQEHRGGLESRPFRGNPLVEAYSECLDQINYLNQAHWQGMLTDPRHAEMQALAVALAAKIQAELFIQEATK
jgi:hypothetical protein